MNYIGNYLEYSRCNYEDILDYASKNERELELITIFFDPNRQSFIGVFKQKI